MADPSLFLTNPTRSDPSLAPDGKQSYYVLFPTPNLDAPIDWTVEAPRYRDHMVSVLEERGYVGFGDAIEVEHLTTPLDWAEQGMERGSPFASAHSFSPDRAVPPGQPVGRERGVHRVRDPAGRGGPDGADLRADRRGADRRAAAALAVAVGGHPARPSGTTTGAAAVPCQHGGACAYLASPDRPGHGGALCPARVARQRADRPGGPGRGLATGQLAPDRRRHRQHPALDDGRGGTVPYRGLRGRGPAAADLARARPRRARRPRARRPPPRGDPRDLGRAPAADAAVVQPRRVLLLRPGPAGARRAEPLRERGLRTARVVPDRRGPAVGGVTDALRPGLPDPAAGRGRRRRHPRLLRGAAVPPHRPDRRRPDGRLPATPRPRARDRPAQGRLAGPAEPPGPDALRGRRAQRRPDGGADGGRPDAGGRAASDHRDPADRTGRSREAHRSRGPAVRRPAVGRHPGQLAASGSGRGSGPQRSCSPCSRCSPWPWVWAWAGWRP